MAKKKAPPIARRKGNSVRSAAETPAGDKTRRGEADSDHLLITALGASAGGLEALEQFFKHMPADSGIAFVVVQHLAPDHSSALPQLLAKYTRMKVEQAADNGKVAPNHVYVIPPGTTLTIKDCRLHLDAPTEPRGRRTPIDRLFRSLAQDRGENAVCIMLSGTGTDGTLGLREIKENGGMAMAQTLESAKYAEILRSAISTGLVDHVLPVAEMPPKLLEYAAHLKSLNGKPSHIREQIGKNLSKIHALLRRKAGHDFSQYKESTIRRRLERRMKALQIETVEQYVQTLDREPEEADQLFKDLLIGVTQFFRNPEAFAALEREVVPKLFEGKDSKDEVRACVVGCASGEEAYSIAILLCEHASTRDDAPRIKILATDIDERALEMARKGLYPEGIAEHLTPERLERFFVKKDHCYQVKRELRDTCIFSNHSFIKDPPFSRLNLISCRNVMIYLGPELQRKMIPLFHYALSSGGYLFLGPAEAPPAHPGLFHVLDKKCRIFQKNDGANRPALELSFTNVHDQRVEIQRETEVGNLSAQLERTILQRYRPACVAVRENGDAVYFSGRIGRYLEQPTGGPETNVINMSREGLRTPLRMALHRAASTHQRAVQNGISVQLNGGMSSVDITVEPLAEIPKPNLYMIVFEETPVERGWQGSAASKRDPDYEEVIRRLESEVRSAHEREQAAFEELETTNEELRSANEEYQSTNEELETSKEELQSFNEELETINAELNRKVGELDEANSVLQNLLNSTRIATIFLDSELRIKSFTPATISMFRLIPADVGRPITDLAARFADGEFSDDISEVLRTISTRERQLTGEGGRHYQMRVLPYRTVHNVIDGVVITFTDITFLSEAEQHAREAEKRALEAQTYADSIIRTVREPLLVLDADLRVKSANSSFYETFRVTPEETEGVILYDLGNRQWDIPDLRCLLAEILPQHGALEDFRVEHNFPRVGQRTMLLNARMIQQPRGRTDLILLAIEDITKRAGIEQSREDELGHTRKELQALTKLLMKTQEEERRRLARDLHDDLGQELALIEMEIQMPDREGPQGQAEDLSQMERIRRRVSALSDKVRALSHQLHPSVLEDLGLEAALRDLIEDFEKARNLAVHLSFDDLHRPVPLTIATALYRIVQEALHNTAKHAPESLVKILVTSNSETVQLSIDDTGPGFDLAAARAKRGLGIVSMEERARQVGGKFEIQSVPGGSTQIAVTVPWRGGTQFR